MSLYNIFILLILAILLSILLKTDKCGENNSKRKNPASVYAYRVENKGLGDVARCNIGRALVRAEYGEHGPSPSRLNRIFDV